MFPRHLHVYRQLPHGPVLSEFPGSVPGGGREFFHDIATSIANSHMALSYLDIKLTVDRHLILRIRLHGAVPLFSDISLRNASLIKHQNTFSFFIFIFNTL
jgi:hypothetical protein